MGSPNAIVTAEMLNSGYLPGIVLGKNNTGMTEPIETIPKTD